MNRFFSAFHNRGALSLSLFLSSFFFSFFFVLFCLFVVVFCCCCCCFFLYGSVSHLGDICIQNIHLGRYYRRLYGRKFRFTAMRQRRNVISDHITDYIPPQMKILHMVIPILMHFLTFIRQRHNILHHTEASSET